VAAVFGVGQLIESGCLNEKIHAQQRLFIFFHFTNIIKFLVKILILTAKNIFSDNILRREEN